MEEEDEDEQDQPNQQSGGGQGNQGGQGQQTPSIEDQITSILNSMGPQIQQWAQEHGINPQQMTSELWSRVSSQNVDVQSLEQTIQTAWADIQKQAQDYINQQSQGQTQPPEQQPGQGQGQGQGQDQQDSYLKDWKEQLESELKKLSDWGSNMGTKWAQEVKDLWDQAMLTGIQNSQAWQGILADKWDALNEWENKSAQQEQS